MFGDIVQGCARYQGRPSSPIIGLLTWLISLSCWVLLIETTLKSLSLTGLYYCKQQAFHCGGSNAQCMKSWFLMVRSLFFGAKWAPPGTDWTRRDTKRKANTINHPHALQEIAEVHISNLPWGLKVLFQKIRPLGARPMDAAPLYPRIKCVVDIDGGLSRGLSSLWFFVQRSIIFHLARSCSETLKIPTTTLRM